MKFSKYIIMLFILLSAFSCKKTSLTITEPGPDFFLNKLMNGEWEGVALNGDTLTVGDKNYTFEDSLLGFGGVFSNGDEYIITVPAGSQLGTVTLDKTAMDAINGVIDIVGSENTLGVVNGIIENVGNIDPNNPTTIDPEKVLGNIKVPEEEKNKAEDIFNSLNDGKNHFGSAEIIGPKK